jgi:hypothetical protein
MPANFHDILNDWCQEIFRFLILMQPVLTVCNYRPAPAFALCYVYGSPKRESPNNFVFVVNASIQKKFACLDMAPLVAFVALQGLVRTGHIARADRALGVLLRLGRRTPIVVVVVVLVVIGHRFVVVVRSGRFRIALSVTVSLGLSFCLPLRSHR